MTDSERIAVLKTAYKRRHAEICARLSEFEHLRSHADSKRLFAELAFCLCTPQSKAESCWKAVSAIAESGLLYNGDAKQIAHGLKGVRFQNNKAKYIMEARRLLPGLRERLLGFSGQVAARDWLVKNVKGLGLKEATHFLRNIGLATTIAILDRHIMKNLVKYGAISSLPKTLTTKNYLEIEKKMCEFSKQVKIPMAELDLLWWAEEAGHVFK
jgi:N-glycosylase/DNA lyase